MRRLGERSFELDWEHAQDPTLFIYALTACAAHGASLQVNKAPG